MESSFASLHDHFPDGFFMQRHRPVIMPETHSHGHIEVLLPVGCSLTYHTQTGLYRAEPDKLSVLWGHIPHRVTKIEGAGEILIANIPLAELLSWSMPETFLGELLTGKLVSANACDPLYQSLFERWIEDLNSDDTNRCSIARVEIQLSLRRQSLMGWHARKLQSLQEENKPSIEQQSQMISSRQSSRVIAMIRFIAENFTQPIDIAQIATAGGVSKGHAMGIFKKMLGTNINRFLTQLRLHHAKSALSDTDDKILTIALDSGFGSLSRFYEVFLSETGHTPQSFRKSQHQAKN